MSFLKQISLVVILLSLTIVGTSAVVIKGETVGETVDKYVADVQKGYKKGDKTMECPIMRAGYIARVQKYDFSTGRTYCKVYDVDKNTKIASGTAKSILIYNENKSAKDYYNSISDTDRLKIDGVLKKKWDTIGVGIITSATHKKLQDKYFKHYISTGGDEFMPSSKYLLAGITMDGERINLKKSIMTNNVVLNAGYTIHPNASVTYDNRDFLSKLWSSVKSIFSSHEQVLKDADNVKGWENQQLSTSTREMLDNIMVYVMEFTAEGNEIYNDVTFWMLLIVLPFTMFFGLQRMITKKIHKHHHQDDVSERLMLGIMMFFFFFIGQTTYKIDAERNIDQSQFQNSSRFFLYKGVDWADDLTRAMAKSYMSFTIKDAGIIGKDNSKALEYSKNKDIKKQKDIHDILENKCFEYYDVAKIADVHPIGNQQHFTPDRVDNDYSFLKPAYKGLERDTAYPIQDVPTINACYDLKREHQVLNMSIASAKASITKFDLAVSSGGVEERINLVSEYIYKSTADNGFLAAPLIGTANIFLDGIEAFETEYNSEKVNDKKIDNKKTDHSLLNDISDKAAYMMVPGASSLRETIYSFFQTDGDTIIGKALNVASAGLSLVVTILIMVTMVKYAPILAMTASSILVIVFYYISVEVFYLTAPFIIVYAFASNQQQMLISLLSRFLALVLKPIQIVFSIVLAMLAIKLFEGIGISIITVNFDMFQQILDIDVDKAGSFWENIEAKKREFWGNQASFIGISFIGSVAKLLMSAFATVSVFYIVFNGSDMFAKMLGFKEAGIDVHESIGREMDNGSSRYTRPI